MSSCSSGNSENGYKLEPLVTTRVSDEQELIPTDCGAGAHPLPIPNGVSGGAHPVI
jgi:hypothetical protein